VLSSAEQNVDPTYAERMALRLRRWVNPLSSEFFLFASTCRFCGKDGAEVSVLFPATKVCNGPGSINICNECISLYYRYLTDPETPAAT
jgi:hypothetical protein